VKELFAVSDEQRTTIQLILGAWFGATKQQGLNAYETNAGETFFGW